MATECGIVATTGYQKVDINRKSIDHREVDENGHMQIKDIQKDDGEIES